MNLERLRKARERQRQSELRDMMSLSDAEVFLSVRGWARRLDVNRWVHETNSTRNGMSIGDATGFEMRADQSELLAAIDEVLASGGAGRHDR